MFRPDGQQCFPKLNEYSSGSSDLWKLVKILSRWVCLFGRKILFSTLHYKPLHTPFVASFHFSVFTFFGGFGELSVGRLCTKLLQRALTARSKSNNRAAAATGCVSVCFIALIRHGMHYLQCFPIHVTAHMSIDQLEPLSGSWRLPLYKHNPYTIEPFFPLPCCLNKNKLAKAEKSVGLQLEPTQTCHRFNCCNVSETQRACACSRDLLNPGGKWVTWSGKEDMYSSCGSIKTSKHPHYWSRWLEKCQWLLFSATNRLAGGRLADLLKEGTNTNVQRPELCAKPCLTLGVCELHCRTTSILDTKCLVHQFTLYLVLV